jgi:hypothetical protein
VTVKGIDVSAYQPSDYQTAGFDFVFIKATEGTSYVNPKMTAQTARGRVAGLVVGFYHFLHPGNIDAQAKYFVAKAASAAGDVLVCDWETTGSGTRATSTEKDQFLRAVKTLRPDHRVLLYCNTDYWVHRDTSSYAADGLWIADPNNTAGSPGIKASWLFHQYSSSGGLDRNLGNFTDKAALAAWAAGTTPEEDPMAGMTKQDVHDAVWKIDDIRAGSTETDPKNVDWQPQSYLKGTFENTVKLLTMETAQTAAITKLAQLVGSDVDTAAVVAAVQKAIADAVVKVSVDVTGPSTP